MGFYNVPTVRVLPSPLSSGYEALKDILTILKEEGAKAGLEFRVEGP
jgi:hypothetical protein